MNTHRAPDQIGVTVELGGHTEDLSPEQAEALAEKLKRLAKEARAYYGRTRGVVRSKHFGLDKWPD